MMNDSKFWPEGVTRCHLGTYSIWLAASGGLLAWGLLAAFLCFWKGLNQTNMNDYFAFGVWIVFDLGVIALGAGAFFTGFMTYILRRKETKNIVNAAVVIGFICYSSAIGTLLVDIGQPLRGWFSFWHGNVHSMLAEVVFCLTTYLVVLAVEFLPLVLDNRQVSRLREMRTFSHHMHRIMIVFAGTGAFLSFFHQGSLGGMYGVLFARPYVFREGLLIWPWTFFLFIFSAMAVGPSFTTLIVTITEKISGRKLVAHDVKMFMAKVSGGLLAFYLVFKLSDTFYWIMVKLPQAGQTLEQLYPSPYGTWLLWLELGLCGVLPAVMLLTKAVRRNLGWMTVAMALASIGIVVNRFAVNIPNLAQPVLPFEKFIPYMPTWQEWAVVAASIGYGMLLFSLAYRYLPLFPQEAQLNQPK